MPGHSTLSGWGPVCNVAIRPILPLSSWIKYHWLHPLPLTYPVYLNLPVAHFCFPHRLLSVSVKSKYILFRLFAVLSKMIKSCWCVATTYRCVYIYGYAHLKSTFTLCKYTKNDFAKTSLLYTIMLMLIIKPGQAQPFFFDVLPGFLSTIWFHLFSLGKYEKWGRYKAPRRIDQCCCCTYKNIHIYSCI